MSDVQLRGLADRYSRWRGNDLQGYRNGKWEEARSNRDHPACRIPSIAVIAERQT